MSKSINSRRFLFGFLLAGSMVALTGCGAIADAVDEAAKEAEAESSPSASPGEQSTDVHEIKVGDCMNDQSVEEQVTELPIVPCEKPHDSEVFANGESASPEWPGEEALSTEADELCESKFADFVGISYDESSLTIGSYNPSKESWADGDRRIDCMIGDANGQVTGSLKGSAR
ncbi:putative regulator of septum formation [Murinocardiopsis flavida]|uniref:Putative regulator of septum formation n=1 Tax=Murinocardiopsis flavida TaxID=645275 RepID=A0A2P8DLD3_9ACTN|nr:septum formation family protein [Murinocardiopsis flavida]PSK98019.1 putative regulator of septum formation [Murinocardiopsis flavida]